MKENSGSKEKELAADVAFLRGQVEEISNHLEDKIAELSIIREMGEALTFVDDFEATCKTILQVVIDNTLAQNFSIMLYDQQKKRLFLVAASDPQNKLYAISIKDLLAAENLRYSFQHGQGVAGRALETMKPVLVADTANSSFFSRDAATKVSIGSMLSVPLLYHGSSIGVINISHCQADIFQPRDIYLFTILADFIALLLESSLDRQRLKTSEKKYRTLAENSNDGIAILVDKIHVYANPRYQALTGYSLQELQQMSFSQLMYSNGGNHELIHGLPWSGKQSYKLLKGVLIGRNQQQIEFEANIVEIEHNGEPASLISLRDLSYRRNLEKQLRQFQKMEAIGTLAGGVAHDFNNILSAIIGYTELTVRKIPLANPVHNYLQQILKAGDRAKSLIKQILTFSRQTEQDDDKIVRVDLIIKEVLRLLRATLPTSIEIQQDIVPECYARIDPILVHQIIMNLSINASHAMQQNGGILFVHLGKKDFPADDWHEPSIATGHYIHLAVQDTGIGMDEALLDRIFEPYFTTKGQGIGTGMGLAVVHGIVKSHRGYLTVKSAPGKGTTFDLFLPRIPQSLLDQQRTTKEIATGTENILLVDDEDPPGNWSQSVRMFRLFFVPVSVNRSPKQCSENSGSGSC
ncbi:MAG: ATP-binding protein [Deltaproteobacteria bacterium]